MTPELLARTSAILVAATMTAARATSDPDSQVREKAAAGLLLLGLRH